MLKSIGYAYASSTYAARLHRARQGCYFIELKSDETDTNPRLIPTAFDCLKSADRAARDMHWAAWSRYSMRVDSPPAVIAELMAR